MAISTDLLHLMHPSPIWLALTLLKVIILAKKQKYENYFQSPHAIEKHCQRHNGPCDSDTYLHTS